MCDSFFQENMNPTLGYFKLRGWAGPIRLLLAYLEVDYVEKFYQLPVPDKRNEWKEYQNTPTNKESLANWKLEKYALGLPFPNLPYWIEGEFKVTETKAILRHIARTRNPMLLGQTLDEMARVNMIEEVLWDMWNSLCQVCLKNDEIVRNDFLGAAKEKLEQLSTSYSGTWAIGKSLTVADFLLYEILYHYELFSKSLLQPFPKLRAFMMRFECIPQIGRCMKSKQFITGPCYSSKFKSRL